MWRKREFYVIGYSLIFIILVIDYTRFYKFRQVRLTHLDFLVLFDMIIGN